MPQAWIYYLALVLPLALRVAIIDTGHFLDWLWYNGYEDYYNFLNHLRVQTQYATFVGGWPLPVFTLSVISYWMIEADYGEHNIEGQFLLLPLAYVPFTIIGYALTNWQLDMSTLYTHPLIVITAGYLYLLPWLVFVATFKKLRLIL